MTFVFASLFVALVVASVPVDFQTPAARRRLAALAYRR